MKYVALGLVAASLCLPCLADDPTATVKIVKVLHDTQPQKRESVLERDISPNEVGKFKELTVNFAPKPDGEYLTVIWKNSSRKPLQHVTVTLLYRQIHLPSAQSATIYMDQVRRGTTYSNFQVIKDAYSQGGPITAWKAVIAADGKELDSFHSFLWKEKS